MTLGQAAIAPGGPNTPNADFFQVSVASGNAYMVPANGTITSWDTNATAGASQSATFKVFRAVANQPGFYSVVAHDGPHNLTPGLLNPFTVSIPVQAGDFIGLEGTNINILNAGIAGDTVVNKPPPGLNDGESASFINTINNTKVNLSATFEPTPSTPPSNAFTLAGTTLNKKNGTATLNFTLPAPGDLTGSGPGVSAASAGRATISKAVGAGPATLVISAAGKQKKKLRQKGKVTLNVTVTYTPTGGAPKTQSVSVKLKLKKKQKK